MMRLPLHATEYVHILASTAETTARVLSAKAMKGTRNFMVQPAGQGGRGAQGKAG